MRISDWSSDVCSSDLGGPDFGVHRGFDPDRAQCAVRHGLSRSRAWPVRQGRPGQCPGCRHAGARPVASSGIEAFARSEEHTSELQSLMRISYAVFCLKKKKTKKIITKTLINIIRP